MKFDDDFSGEIQEKSDSGIVFIQIKNGRKEGVTRLVDKNGSLLSEIEYHDDEIDGSIKQYYPNGQVSSVVSYKNGTQTGAFTTFYESGMVQMETTYLDGVLDGTFTLFDEFGDKMSECTYKNGCKQGESRAFFPKAEGGQVAEISNYVDDLLDGERTTYYPSGELMTKTTYSKGKPQEYPQKFDKNGNRI